jgi:hypothetical protein
MLLIISDASVLIDVECSQLTSAMFSLPWKFYVPDVLFEEELAQRHEHLLAFGLKTIWLVEQLIQHEKITVDVAEVAFQRMKISGSRLPWKQVETLLSNLRTT